MADVRIGHDQTSRSHARHATAAGRSTRDGDVLAERVAIADLHSRRLTGVLQVLRCNAQAGKRKDAILLAHRQMAVEHDVRDKLAAFAEYDVRSNRAVGTHRAALGNLRACSNDRCRVDAHSGIASLTGAAFFAARGTTWHITIASHTSFPSTVILPSIFTARLRQFSTVTS